MTDQVNSLTLEKLLKENRSFSKLAPSQNVPGKFSFSVYILVCRHENVKYFDLQVHNVSYITR